AGVGVERERIPRLVIPAPVVFHADIACAVEVKAPLVFAADISRTLPPILELDVIVNLPVVSQRREKAHVIGSSIVLRVSYVVRLCDEMPWFELCEQRGRI